MTRDEVSAWPEPEKSVTGFLRGAGHVAAAPLVELAQAPVDLAAGELSPAPAGRFWYFGTPEGRTVQGGQGTLRRPCGQGTLRRRVVTTR